MRRRLKCAKVPTFTTCPQTNRLFHCYEYSPHRQRSASGSLEAMLERAANNQERDVQGIVKTSLRLFEPALILIMGSIVLYIVMSDATHIFNGSI